MKTTVEIPDSLLRAAKRRAIREGTTVRALVERGLRLVVADRQPSGPFRLRDATFAGDGLAEGQALQDWDALRDLIYKGRGA